MTAYEKSIQYALIDEMRRRNVYSPIVELKANRSKDERIEGMVPRYANGSIYHLLQCPFREQLEDELDRFPRGKHDDIIDALAYGMQIASPSGAHNPRFTRGEDKRPNKYLY
jgi:phage terminase large subunit-like protein